VAGRGNLGGGGKSQGEFKRGTAPLDKNTFPFSYEERGNKGVRLVKYVARNVSPEN